MIKHIKAGTLNLKFSYGEGRFNDLITLASRENHKRGFLFVSKVLGKHVPVLPKVKGIFYHHLLSLSK